MRSKQNHPLRPLLWVALLAAVGAALLPSSHAWQPASSADPRAPTALGEPSDSSAVTDPKAADRSSNPPTEEGWMQRVDGFFGTWIVTPMAAVIFYDFGTSQWLGTSVPFVVIWLLGGAIYFTIRMGFISVRGFGHAIRLTRGDYDDPNETGEVSHFQALASALSATVGLGNIAGVAIAVATGGPGATFWLVLAGFLGMSSKFAECALGQMYRKVAPDGTVSGGAMHYLRDGLRELGLKPLGSVLAFLFTIMCIGGSFGGGNAFQVGQSLSAIRGELPIVDQYPWIYGLVMAVCVGVVIIGGIRSIGRVAEKIVPFMCGAYVLAALYIVFTHIDRIVPAFQLILSEAFRWESAYGGFLGVMVIGIRRAVFSNEAGVGSAAIAHSAAKTEWPIREGLVALLEPFIDTIVVCTMSALVIVITGVHERPEFAHFVKGNQGAALMTEAFRSGGHAWFRWILYGSVVLFAYSTLISWSYYGERCWTSLFGPRSSLLYKLIFLCFCVLGSIVHATNIMDFSDLLILGMAFPNVLGVILLSGKVRSALDDYCGRLRRGEFEKDRHEATARRKAKK